MVNKYKELNRIAKEGHSFPHYNTCNTCIDDFDQVVQYALDCVAFAMELRRRGLTLDIENDILPK